MATMAGYARTEAARAFMSQRSPLTQVAQIKRPLLVVQGGNDPIVNQAESDQMVQAMQDLNLPVTYLLYPDEGHNFDFLGGGGGGLSFFPVMESFLAQCLGGRFEPVGDEFQGAQITVPTGAELITGLAEALAETG